MAEPARHFSVKTLAARWSVGNETVRRAIKRNRLGYLRIEGTIRIPLAAVVAYEERHLCSAAPAPGRCASPADSPGGASGNSRGVTAADLRKFQRARRHKP